MSFFSSRLFRGQIVMLIAVITMIYWNSNLGNAAAILIMGVGLYWILTSESRYFDRLQSR